MKQEKAENRIRNEHINILLGTTAPDSWLIFPRYVNSLLRAGVIAPTEYIIYCYIRNECNAYGCAVTSIENIKNDIFPRNRGISSDWVNKVLRSLKNKGIIFYKDRKGVVGSFEVYMDDFLLPSGKYSSLKNKVNKLYIAGESVSESGDKPYYEVNGHTPDSESNPLIKEESQGTDSPVVVGCNTDKDTEKDNNTVSMSNKSKEYRCRTPVEGYSPVSYEDKKALEIARALCETCMDSYLSLIKKGHFWALEKAYGQYRESNIIPDNPAAYLNSVVQRLVINNAKEKIGKKI